LEPRKNRNGVMLALVALFIALIIPKLVRMLAEQGFVASLNAMRWGTVGMAAICLVGAMIAYRSAQAQVRRDLHGGVE
jgi:hypothetical protein